MRDWLTVELVLGTLLVTTFTTTGLVGLWAATSRWHWFLRTLVVLGVLSPLLLRPMYDPFVTLVTQCGVIALGIAVYTRRAIWWKTLRGRRGLSLPRYSMRSMLGVTVLIAVATAVAVSGTRLLGPYFWVAAASLGIVVGTTSLIAAWLAADTWSWKRLFVVCLGLALLAFPYDANDYFESVAPTVNFWPHTFPYPSIFPQVVQYLRGLAYLFGFVALQYMFLLGWRRVVWPMNGKRPSLVVMRAAMVAATFLLVAFPLFIGVRLHFPTPFPKKLIFEGDEARFQELLALSDRFTRTAVWKEICANQIDQQRMADAIKVHGKEFDQLHGLLEERFLRPVTIDWVPGKSTAHAVDLTDLIMDENSQLSVLANVLSERAEAARREGDNPTAIESVLDLLTITELTSRPPEFSSYFRADAFELMAAGEIFRTVPFLDDSECEVCIRRLADVERRRYPINRLLRYYQAYWDNVFGWHGHLTQILGDVVNCLDPSLDANLTGTLRFVDRRSRTVARLLIIELALRQYFLRHNRTPDSLELLVPTVSNTFITDPFDTHNGPFQYRIENGDFVLYSVGYDGDDDGGEPPPRNEYGGFDWDEDGDLRLDAYFAEVDGIDADAETAGTLGD